MKSPVVRLKIRVRLPDGSRPYLDPVFSANRKLKAGYAVVSGKPEHYPGSVYYLRYLDGDRRVWRAVGTDCQLAKMEYDKCEAKLGARSVGLALAGEFISPTSKSKAILSVSKAELKSTVVSYLKVIHAHKSKKTHAAYALTLYLFVKSFERPAVSEKLIATNELVESILLGRDIFLQDLNRNDLLNFMTFLKLQKNAPRTIANRISYLKTFLAGHGVANPLHKSDKPKFTEKTVSSYSSHDVKALLKAASREEAELLQFFLFTGAREQEVQFATWRDIDFQENTFKVSEKLDLAFTPKDKEEGEIPVPDSLVAMLRERRIRYPDSRLIFCNSLGDPQGHFLRIIKRLGLRAGLNCGQCYSRRGLCCSKHAVCTRMELHRLRKTFATMHHEAGIPVRTIQRWLRHSSLDTTLHYLAASDDRSERTRQQVNNTFASFV